MRLSLSRGVGRGLGVLVAAGVAAAALAPAPAAAWWRGGVFFGFPPVVVAPPVYVGPPVAYAPYAPYTPYPQVYASAPGQLCVARVYQCPMLRAEPPGSPCSCPTNGGGRAGGVVQ